MTLGRLIRAAWSVVERFLAAAALVVLAPVAVAIAAAVVVTTGRPVLFVQNRVGKGGALFPMVKFRTMVGDAIAVGQAMKITDDPFGIVDNDPRVTRVGRILRRTSLDELPQLWNVVRGEMSLVGPRPDVPEQACHYDEAARRRLAVRPGITGWAQVNGRDDIPWPERFELDAWYVNNRSVRLDMRILLRTVAEFRRIEPVMTVDEHNVARRATANR